MDALTTIYRYLRVGHWWNPILGPITSVIFMIQLQCISNFGESLCFYFHFMALAICTAAFGFFVGEWCDQKDDQLVGKINAVSNLPQFWKLLILLCIFSSLICIAAITLNRFIQVVLFIALLTSLLMYSVPPFRLKRFFSSALLLDSLYSGALFISVVLFSFNCVGKFWIAVCFTLFFLKGCRNILVHLHTDTQDQKIQQYPLLKNYTQIVELLAVIEILLLIVVSYKFLSPGTGAITGLLVLAIMASKYLFSNSAGQPPFQINRLNLFYETIWPLLFIFHLILKDSSNLLFLILQVLLFSENQRLLQAGFNKLKLR